MAGFCPALPADAGLVRQLLGGVDCNVEGLAAGGYAALARSDGPVAPLLTAALTLYVAFIGYRLLLGRGGLNVGELTLSAFKIAAVLTLATNWSAYQVLVYDALFHGPEQLASRLLATLQPEGSAFRGDPFAGLQTAYDVLTEGAAAFAGRAGAASPLLGGVAFSAAALNGAALLLLVSTAGTLLVAKVVLAILLALAPLFAGLLLFDATRGMVGGWLKAALAFALTPLAVTLTLAVELTALEPGLIALVRMRQPDGVLDAGVAMQLALLTLVFAGVLSGLAVAGAVVAAGLRLPGRTSRAAVGVTAAERADAGQPVLVTSATSSGPPREARAATALAALDRRDAQMEAVAATGAGDRRITLAVARADASGGEAAPLGRSFRRSSGPRRSTVADRRDATGAALDRSRA